MKNNPLTTPSTPVSAAPSTAVSLPVTPPVEAETAVKSPPVDPPRIPARAVPIPSPVALGDLGLKSVRAIPGALAKAAAVKPADELQHFFVSSFNVRGAGIRMVEVPNSQNPKLDVEASWRAIRAQYPQAGTNDIRRLNSKVESRPGGGVPTIKLTDGMTIRQLFPDGSPFESSRVVGEVVFDGEPCQVILRHIRAKSVFSLTLKSRTGGNATRFSEQVTVMRLAAELPVIIENMLDGNAPGLKLFFTK